MHCISHVSTNFLHARWCSATAWSFEGKRPDVVNYEPHVRFCHFPLVVARHGSKISGIAVARLLLLSRGCVFIYDSESTK